MRSGRLLLVLVIAAAGTAAAAAQKDPRIINSTPRMSPTAAEAPAPPQTRLVVAYERATDVAAFEAQLTGAKRALAARSGARGRAGAAISISRTSRLAPRLLRGTTFVAEANSERSAKELLAHFNSGAVPGVRYAELDGWARPTVWPSECGGTKPVCDNNSADLYDRYWDVRATRADRVWANTAGAFGAGSVKGAVIDVGVQWAHDDLQGVSDASNRVQCLGGSGACPALAAPTNADDDHGTHTSCTMGARYNSLAGSPVGVSQAASLMHCKFLNAKGGSYTDGVRCIDTMVARGAKVLSNSWGGGSGFTPLRDAIARACSKGVVFVVAAGNENTDATRSWPAAYVTDPNAGWCMLSVAATDKNNGRASFSNYGSSVNIAAPGVRIVSCVTGYTAQPANPSCTNCLGVLSGTSMSTPHVAGAALAIMSMYPALTNRQVVEALRAGGTPITTDAALLPNARVLNVEAAVARAAQLARPPCASSADCSSDPSRPFCSATLGCVACLDAGACTSPPGGAEATCVAATCTGGACAYLKPTGAACTIAGSGQPGICSSTGTCGQCNSASDCTTPPAGFTSSSCFTGTCTSRTCSYPTKTGTCFISGTTGSCSNGACVAPTCKASGTRCTSNSSCCSRWCSGSGTRRCR